MTLLLDELLRVKRIREDKAIKSMKEKQLKLKQCRKFLRGEIMQHDKYAAWREKEERRLYKEVLDKAVRVYNITIMRDQITSFKDKQQQFKERIAQAEAEVSNAAHDLANAKRTRMDAYRTVRKYEEYQAIVQTSEDQEAQRRTELEAEEFSLRPRHRP